MRPITISIAENEKLMNKWDWEKNEKEGHFPDQIGIGSRIPVWWHCEYGHSYPNDPAHEIRDGRRCPVCRDNRTEHIYDRDDLLQIWATEDNASDGLSTSLSTGSSKVAFWTCEHGHIYPRAINKQAAPGVHHCPLCRKHLSDFPNLLPEFAYDLNEKRPEEISYGADDNITWRCLTCGNTWSTSPYHRIKEETGCPYCAGLKHLVPGVNDIETKNPPNLQYWDYEKNAEIGLHPNQIALSSQKRAWFLCEKGHSTFEIIKKALNRKNVCTECIRIEKEKRLQLKQSKKEKIAAKMSVQSERITKADKKQTDKTEYIRIEKEKRLQLKQSKKEKRAAKMSVPSERITKADKKRTDKTAGKFLFTIEEIRKLYKSIITLAEKKEIDIFTTVGLSNLGELFEQELAGRKDENPDYQELPTVKESYRLINGLEQFWDSRRNYQYGYCLEALSENTPYNWRCECGHQWVRSISEMREAGCVCPYCLKEHKSIAAKYPNVVQWFDVDRNGIKPTEVHAGEETNTYYWWKCSVGHHSLVTLKSILSHPETGCIYCAREKSIYSL